MSVLNDTEKRAFREIPRSLFRWTADHLSLILFVFFYITILVWLVAYTLLLLHQIRTSSVLTPRIEAGPLLERVDAVSRGQDEIHRSIRDLGQKVGTTTPEVDLKPVMALLGQISGRVKDQGQEARANTEMVLKIIGDQRKVIEAFNHDPIEHRDLSTAGFKLPDDAGLDPPIQVSPSPFDGIRLQ